MVSPHVLRLTQIDLTPRAGSQSIEIGYLLGYKSGTSAVLLDGFGFTYDLATTRALAAPTAAAFDFAAGPTTFPEPSAWVMMLMGLAGLGLAGAWKLFSSPQRPTPDSDRVISRAGCGGAPFQVAPLSCILFNHLIY